MIASRLARGLAAALATAALASAGLAAPAASPAAELRAPFRAQLRVGGDLLALDVYPSGRAGGPAVVLLYGSGGLSADRALRYAAIARSMAQAGFAVLVPHYLDAPVEGWVPAVRAAVTYARRRVGASGVGVAGFSLGGRLALRAAASDRRVGALVTVAAYTPDGFDRVEAARLPPTLMVSGDQDGALATLELVSGWLRGLGKPCSRRVHRGVGHDFPVDLWDEDWRLAVRFFAAKLR